MKARVDLSKCMGYAACVAEVPKMFEIDETTGQSRVVTEILSDDLLERARQAARSCPTFAIVIG
jgi:ferredoxin